MVWLVCSSHTLHVRNRWPCPGGPKVGFPRAPVWPWHVPGGALAGHYHSFHLTEYGDDVEGKLLNKSFWMHAGHLVVLNGITRFVDVWLEKVTIYGNVLTTYLSIISELLSVFCHIFSTMPWESGSISSGGIIHFTCLLGWACHPDAAALVFWGSLDLSPHFQIH